MANVAQWISGARPRTLPNAVAPVIAGTGAAAWLHSAVWWKALLALAVALALIVGVNYANDYSDGIRGTDDNRAGPMRLVGARLATPRSVLAAAVTSLAVGAAAGLALALLTAPWLIAVGAACIAGAWLYTGGSRPYGYAGFGEVAVFVFFGLVAVLGTQYTQALRVDWVGLVLAVSIGALSSAVLVANNLRDIPTDTAVGQDHPGGAPGRCPHPGALPSAAGQRRGADPGADGRDAVVCRRDWWPRHWRCAPRARAIRPWRARAHPGAARHRAGHAGVGDRGGAGIGPAAGVGALTRPSAAPEE